jgi:hypothetical protein
MPHPMLNRTSPKGPGQPFIGTCPACGQTGLTSLEGDCPNQRGMTQEQALIEAIEGPPSEDKTP